MFIGHYAVALAAKKAAPATSLGTLFLAVQLADMVWPVLLLLGIEHVRIDPGNTVVTPLDFYDYPISHSLLGVVIGSLGLALLYYAFRRYRRGAIVVGLCVLSHWLLDFLTHRPDLPLGFTGDSRVGLGLWNSLAGTIIVEAGMFVAGIVLYLRSTKSKDKMGVAGFWGLIGFIGLIYVANLSGPPPPNVTLIAVAGNAMWVLVLWAYVVGRHRTNAQDQSTLHS